MLYCINMIRAGPLAALASFLIWSLPGALGMYALSIGVSNIDEKLPAPVYALLSGLNAATVGVIALAAVELSRKAITDKLTRIVVFFTGAAGMLYNALWYFPVLMAISGAATLIFDYRWVHRPISKLVKAIRRQQRDENLEEQGQISVGEGAEVSKQRVPAGISTTPIASSSTPGRHEMQDITAMHSQSSAEQEPRIIPPSHQLNLLTWKAGTAIIGCFLTTFVVVMAVRSAFPPPGSPLLYRLFSNMYLAGTIIFGGGPVVVPLLREYVVAEGWVAPRDFLIGLALIQAFPGPNFNFAVFLGSLTAINGGHNSVAGAVIAWFGIFAPGLALVHGTMGVWGAVRNRRWMKAIFRGVNAGAVGLIYTAVYRIFMVGYIDVGFQSGRSLGDDPWWVVITATSYVGGRYFGLNAPLAIVLGGALGLIRYAVVS